jgi:uncharacterized SAM-binding protein YcdF (DUF218 family)
MTRIIIIPSYNTSAEDWISVMWGSPPNTLGRIPKALQILLRQQIDYIIWSGGIINDPTKSEAQETYEFTLTKLNSLSSIFAQTELIYIQSKLQSQSIFESNSRDSKGNASFTANLITQHFSNQHTEIFVVSSNNHIPRLAKHFTISFSNIPTTLYFIPCDTSYSGGDIRKTFIWDHGLENFLRQHPTSCLIGLMKYILPL